MRILITVKTYPTISETLRDEIVCTAGLNEDGEWIRLYPIPFRSLDYVSQYKKYDWIEVDVKKHKSDWRHESYSPVNLKTHPIRIIGHLDTKHDWKKRKNLALRKIYTDLAELIDDSKETGNKISLTTFKPTSIDDFICTPVTREWEPKKIAWLQQQNLFEDVSQKKIIRKIPYKFSYKFRDINNRESTLMIEDWELGQLFWKQLARKGNEEEARLDVKKKYFNQLTKKDLHFFLGTNYVHHSKSAKNPFIIVGLFYPPMTSQLEMDFD